MKEKLYTLSIGAKMLSVHINTLRNWIKDNRLEVITTPGGHYRIMKSAMIKFMKEYNFPIPVELDDKQVTIYVIDDEESVLETYTSKLRDSGYTNILTFTNGFDALLRIAETPPNVILLDIYLPKMDGFEFAAKLKRNSTSKLVKIIAISSAKNIKTKTEKSGIDDFYYKGDEFQILVDKIRDVLLK